MERSDFLELLYKENFAGLMLDAGNGDELPIDLFDTSKSDIEKIVTYIDKEFNYVFRVIIQEDYDARQFVKSKFRCVPNKMMKVRHVLDDEEIHSLAQDLLQYEIIGPNSLYLSYVSLYLDGTSKKLSDQDAEKYLQLMNCGPSDLLIWYEENIPGFISKQQIEKFIKTAELNKIIREANLLKTNQYAE
jgi:succinate dehydrogenase flavin-adding protein (antitoxin of CptAB toxin-antitoxin module)